MTIRTLLSLKSIRGSENQRTNDAPHNKFDIDPRKSLMAKVTTSRGRSDRGSTSADVSWACAVCTDKIHDPAIGGACTHHFCHACLLEWQQQNTRRQQVATCPTCRAPIARIMRDPEFASAIGVASLASREPLPHEPPGAQTVQITWPPGITLSPLPGTPSEQLTLEEMLSEESPMRDRPLGLLIADVAAENGAARAGIRRGSILLRINDELVTSDHHQAVAMIERHAAFGTVRLTLAPPDAVSHAPVTAARSTAATSSAYSGEDGIVHTAARLPAPPINASEAEIFRPRSARAQPRRERPFVWVPNVDVSSRAPSRPWPLSAPAGAGADPATAVANDGSDARVDNRRIGHVVGLGGDTELQLEMYRSS